MWSVANGGESSGLRAGSLLLWPPVHPQRAATQARKAQYLWILWYIAFSRTFTDAALSWKLTILLEKRQCESQWWINYALVKSPTYWLIIITIQLIIYKGQMNIWQIVAILTDFLHCEPMEIYKPRALHMKVRMMGIVPILALDLGEGWLQLSTCECTALWTVWYPEEWLLTLGQHVIFTPAGCHQWESSRVPHAMFLFLSHQPKPLPFAASHPQIHWLRRWLPTELDQRSVIQNSAVQVSGEVCLACDASW